MKSPRVLIISNECFSNSNSNGRTLQGFFAGWPSDRIAQFYIQSARPDFSVCKRFFRVTDRQALDAFLGRRKGGGEMFELANADAPSVSSGKTSRTPITMLLRETVWNSRRWVSKAFERWVREFSPEVVLLQAGDCAFMFRLARDIAQKFGIPLVIYNSEGYYFKKFDYFRSKGVARMLYPLFRRIFCREFKKAMHAASHAVYICPALQEDYDREFDTPSSVVFTSTDIALPEGRVQNPKFTVSYLGNLGVGRREGLIEIADALQRISPEFRLDVYGKTADEAVLNAIEACPGINYRGFVGYDDVMRIMHSSDILVHTENFAPFYREDLKYAFSTKLADSLACGTCFLLYAPENLACTRYLRDNAAAYVVSEKAELEDTLRVLAADPTSRGRYLTRAQELVDENHRAAVCVEKFREILTKAAEK